MIGRRTPSDVCQAGAVFPDSPDWSTVLITRIREDVDGFAGGDVAVVATGHTAPLLLPDLETVERYDQNLTLDGLRMVFERNQEGQQGQLKPAR